MEMFSAYITNCYFNLIYVKARDDYNAEKFQNIEDAYKSSANAFHLVFMTTKKIGNDVSHYVQVIDNIRNKFNDRTDYNLTYIGFVEHCTKFLIPAEDYASTSYEIKNDALRKFLMRVITLTTAFAVNEGIKVVTGLDIRKDPSKMQEHALGWKEHIKKILIEEKNNLNSLILLHRSGVDDLSRLDNVNHNVLELREHTEKLYKIIKSQIKEKDKLTRERNSFVLLSQEYRKIIEAQQVTISELQKQRNAIKPEDVKPNRNVKPRKSKLEIEYKKDENEKIENKKGENKKDEDDVGILAEDNEETDEEKEKPDKKENADEKKENIERVEKNVELDAKEEKLREKDGAIVESDNEDKDGKESDANQDDEDKDGKESDANQDEDAELTSEGELEADD